MHEFEQLTFQELANKFKKLEGNFVELKVKIKVKLGKLQQELRYL